jgi:hypothetical protein
MLTTYELRWFYPGTIPENIQFWFEQHCLVQSSQPQEPREDLYLYSPECEFLGIKLRQEQLEVKWRQAELGVISCGEIVEGKVEKWSKWECHDSTGESFQAQQIASNPVWVSVQKVRYAQTYEVLDEFSLQAVSENESINNGCHVELTHLTINENTWWSLAFEAFGDDACILENLQVTANRVFSSYLEQRLLAVDSYAYPAWLAQAIR